MRYPIEERRQMAKRLGASVVVDPSREILSERVMELTKGRGADVVCAAPTGSTASRASLDTRDRPGDNPGVVRMASGLARPDALR